MHTLGSSTNKVDGCALKDAYTLYSSTNKVDGCALKVEVRNPITLKKDKIYYFIRKLNYQSCFLKIQIQISARDDFKKKFLEKS